MAPDPKGIILVSTSASIIRVYGLETAAHGRVLAALTLCKCDAQNASVVQNLEHNLQTFPAVWPPGSGSGAALRTFAPRFGR